MDQRTKRQLVGAAVLVAAAVVFLPMLFTEPEEEEALDVPLEIPQRPAMAPMRDGAEEPDGADQGRELPVDDVVVPETAPEERPDDRAPERERVVEPEPEPVPDPDPEPETSPPREAADPAPAEGGYVVQVGSFSRQENARAESERIRELGFTAFVDEIERDGETLHRVRVGPVPGQEDARALMEELRDRAEVDGYVVRQG